jgi:hypothetical protein
MSRSILDELPKSARRPRRRKTGEDELRSRLNASVNQLVDLASQPTVSRALSAPSAFDSLSILLDKLLQEHPELKLATRDLPSHLELVQARADLLERAGGTYDTKQVAELLDITPEAVRKRVQRGALLAYRTPSGEYRLPRAQFTKSGTIEGLEEVLRAMHVEEAWMRIQLFLDRDVLGALEEGRREDAVRAVAAYLPADEGEE